MDALVMCGGRGSRFDADVEKPLYRVGGRPMVDRVRDALAASRVETTYAVVSPLAPDTYTHLESSRTIETPGEGYIADLNRALGAVDPPVLTVAADLPLLAGDAVDEVLDAHETGPMAVCVPVALKEVLGVSLDRTLDGNERALAPTGVNVVADGDESVHVTHDERLAVNVNRVSDAAVAEALA